MSRFLCATWQAGHVPPVLALAKLLARRGHEVRLLGPAPLAARASDEYAFVGGDHVPDWEPERGVFIEEQLDELVRYLYSPEWRDAVRSELSRGPADVLVCDLQLANAARDLGVTTVFTSVLLFQPWFREYGQFGLGGESTSEVIERSDLTLVLAPAELDFDGDVPGNVRYVGTIADPDPVQPFVSPWPSENDDPLVVISFSTAYQRQELAIAQVAEAVADLPVRALLLAGKGVDVPIPDGVEVREWVPHPAVMPDAALCITHGGLGTIQNALANGVPLLVLPHIYEQALNGYRVNELGAGKLVPAEAEAAEIREAVVEVLGDPSFRQAAELTSAWFEDGGDCAVEALESLAGSA